MIFVIIAGIILATNFVFLILALVYTLKSKGKDGFTPRLSLAPSILSSQLNGRHSIQPQVAIFQAVVQLNSPNDVQSLEKKQPLEDTTKKGSSL
ncbi:unnamed protein product [Arctia plantaginis]|uniref:Uncharacterized protein n=1 Tax=Arctia plantaginis TaxID=874455 RepID=A0A8S0Z1A8_ARCPL|nr:unnamed protein product [Arctia plantaginis]CAB3253455.1 unnamed protein product [Arctia plantaginis]